MKLLYATSIVYPSKLANRIQTLQTAKELQNKLGGNFCCGGLDIKLRKKELKIKNFNFSRKSYFLAFKYLFFIKKNNFTHIYSREERLLFFIILYNKIFFHLALHFTYEAHLILEKKSFWYRKLLNWVDKFVVLTSFIKKELIFLGVKEYDVLVEPDAVDLEKFDLDISKEEVREKLNLPQEKKIITYVGSIGLYDWKGVDVLIKAAGCLDNNFLFLFVGGREEEIQKIQKSKNLIFVGQKEHKQIAEYLLSSDVLVLPNKKGDIVSEKYTSPMKMFEYMASKRPIVASDLPSIREILNENNSILIEPNNPEKLAEGIKKVLDNNDLADKISRQAFEDVQDYTWGKRVKRILNFIG